MWQRRHAAERGAAWTAEASANQGEGQHLAELGAI